MPDDTNNQSVDLGFTQDFPSLINQAKNLTGLVIDVASDIVQGNNPLVPKEIEQQRLDICKGCEYFIKSQGSSQRDRCSKCGCFVTQKTMFAKAECPVQKWNKYE